MSEMMGSHVPSAEFRAKLEEDVVRALRRESQFANGRRTIGRRRLQGLLILLAGVVLGLGAGFGVVQAQNAQERTRLIEAATANRQLAAGRASLAEEALKQTRARFEVGVIGREALMAAEADVLRVRQQVERLDLEIAEIRASSAPPRDELWAPLVGGRDFVSERLKVEAAASQQALTRAEQSLREVVRQLRVGVAGPGVVASAEADVLEARQEVALLAKRLDLRRRSLDGQLDSAAIARELERFEVEAEIQRTTANLRLAQDRAERAKSLASVGVASELDARRAELEALELAAALKLLRSELQEIAKKN